MTTPTREQVVQWIQQASTQVVDHDFAGNPITDGSVLLIGAYGPLVIRAITLSRADLEATIAEQAAELRHYKDIEQEMLMIGVERAKDQFQSQLEEQAAEIERLESRVIDMNAAIRHEADCCDSYKDQLAAEQAYAEQLRKDAERYRCLRDGNIDPELYLLSTPEDLDEAIDAAMKENKQ